MKIGVDARSLSGPLTGIGRYTHEMCKELIKRGHDLVLYSHNRVPVDVLGLESAQVRFLNISNRYMGLVWYQVFLSRWVNNDSLDIFWGPAHKLPFFLSKAVVRVLTIHDLVWLKASDTMPLVNWMVERCLMPYSIRQADWIVTVSHATKTILSSEYPVATAKISTIYPGVTKFPKPSSIDMLAQLGVRKPFCLFVGTMEPRKNLPRLLQAFEKFHQAEDADSTLVVVGGQGWGKLDLEQQIKASGLEGKVVLVGFVDEISLATLYANARFLVMPSTYEGFGLPMVEAMSMGIPVLASNTSSMPEVVGDAGLLFDPYDIEALAKAMGEMFFNEQLYSDLSAQVTYNIRRFNWTYAAQQIEDVFIQVMGKKSKA